MTNTFTKILVILTLILSSKLIAQPTGSIRFNEVVSSNAAGDSSEFKRHSDWFELYNTTASPINIGGLYFTNKANKRALYKMPTGLPLTIIPAKGFVRIWADDSISKPGLTQLHVTFKISSAGAFLGLFQSDTMLVVDSISIGAIATDSSLGRCPDGTGAFKIYSKPTPADSNCYIAPMVIPNGIENVAILSAVYPVPFNQFLAIKNNQASNCHFELFSINGQLVLEDSFTTLEHKINTQDLTSGIYFIKIQQGNESLVYKIYKQD